MDSPWRVLGASVVGTGHIRLGTPCQDAHAYAIHRTGALIAAVGDGAGSARFSQRGSQLAVSSTIEFLSTRLETANPNSEESLDLMRSALVHARERLQSELMQDEWVQRSATLDDFGTTLLFCLVTDSLIATCQVGDGAIVEKRSHGEIRALTNPQKGEYANETTFLTSKGCESAASVSVASSCDTEAIALFTDGIELICMQLPAFTPFAPFFNHLFDRAKSSASSEDIEVFLASAKVNANTADDKTLVIAVRTQQTEPAS